ncbi:hypothetical protein NMY22_g16135 [Coprinellus aureogranulatus]|nr:hypothetical protein NMY22_g16135 [Coprinellus aureogranulatus]
MSAIIVPSQSPQKSKKEKEKERREKAQQQANERVKAVVRRLPPNLPEEIFWQTVQKWVTEDTVSWKVYYSGKFKKRMNKENIPSRAYIAFKNEELLIQFSREFDGHLFKDKAGNESYAIVEYAPYQKVPSEKRKQDSKNNTIEKDEDYISFINSLNAPTGEPVTLEALIAATRPPEPPKTTPLLEALKAEKSAQKDKEAILRNHAHYKDQTNVAAIATNPNRKDDKKKVAPQPPQPVSKESSKASDTPAPLSKKAKKKAAEAQKASEGQKAGTATKTDAKSQAAQPAAPAPAPKPSKKAKAATPATPVAPPVILAAKPPPTPAPVAVTAASPSTKAGSSAPTETPAADATPQRRPRAMIGRHLEVALGGIGASARARREKEKERTSAEAKSAAPATGESATTFAFTPA